MSEKTCPTCGRSWHEMQGVCPVCGKNLGGQVFYEDRPRRPRRTRGQIADLIVAWLWMIALTIIALGFGSSGFVMLTGESSENPAREPSEVVGWIFVVGSVILFGMGALNLNDALNGRQEPGRDR